MSLFNLFLITPCAFTHYITNYLTVQEKHHLIGVSKNFKKIFNKSIFHPLINLYTQSSQGHTYHEFKYISCFQFTQKIQELGIHSSFDDIIFICDTSGSMKRNSKRNSMIHFIEQIVVKLNKEGSSKNVGLISFNRKSEWVYQLTPVSEFPYPVEDHLLDSSGVTNFDSWINLIKNIDKSSILILVSDMVTNIRNKNKYIPILKKHFFYQIILPPGNNYTAKSLNHISNGYGKFFLSSNNGSIPEKIINEMFSLLIDPQPQIICYQSHSRFHPINNFECPLSSSSFLVEDDQQLQQLKELPINIIFNGQKIEQWDSQQSRFITKNEKCPWDIFKMALIKKMSHLNYFRQKLLKKEYTHYSELEEIALEINSLDINNHLECYDSLKDIFNRRPLSSIRGSYLYLPNSEQQNSISTGLLIDLNILVSKTLNSLEEPDHDYSTNLLLKLQDMCQQLVYQRIKRIKNDSLIFNHKYQQLYLSLKRILSQEIKSILKLSLSETLSFNNNYSGLEINQKEFLGDLEGDQLGILVYLYCCLHNSDLFNFHLDGDLAEYIPNLRDNLIVNQKNIKNI